MPLGKVTGLMVGAFIAYFLILPDDILNTLKLSPIPLTDLSRVFACAVVTIATVALDHFLDAR